MAYKEVDNKDALPCPFCGNKPSIEISENTGIDVGCWGETPQIKNVTCVVSCDKYHGLVCNLYAMEIVHLKDGYTLQKATEESIQRVLASWNERA